MTEQSGVRYNYTKTGGFSSAGTHVRNVTCFKETFTLLTADDTILITAPVPEFSTYAILLILITVIGGFFVLKKEAQ